MVLVSLLNNRLVVKVKDSHIFSDVISEIRDLGFSYAKASETWSSKHLSTFKELKESLTLLGEELSVSESDLCLIESATTTGQRKLVNPSIRRIFNPKLMAFPPLVGKPPFERYQSQDIQRALNQNRFLFNWEMGLGKSYATAALIEHLRSYGEIDRVILLTTSIGTFNLKNELVKLGKTITHEEIFVLTSIQDVPFEDRDFFNTSKYPYRIFIMTYDTLRSVCNYYYDKKKGTKRKPHPSRTTDYEIPVAPLDKWFAPFKGALFADESHSISNPSSNRAKTLLSHADYFHYVYLFTGTFADKYEKQYAQYHLLDPAIVGGKPYTLWLKDYGELGTRHSKWAINKEGWNEQKLGELSDFVLKNYAAKREMDACLDLPPDYEVPAPVLEMTPLHRKIYESFSTETTKNIQESRKNTDIPLSSRMVSAFAFYQIALDNPTVLIRTPRFTTSFSEPLQKAIKKFNYLRDNAKVPYFDAIVTERVDENNEKGIIWYLHPETGDALREHYKKYNPYYVGASTPKEDRLPLVAQFSSDKSSSLLIASLLVLNTSATITAAAFQIYAERTYVYTIWKQSRGRIHRPNKKQVTRTYWGVFKDSLDALQSQNLAQKGEVVSRLHSQKFISQSDWKRIFNLTGTLALESLDGSNKQENI